MQVLYLQTKRKIDFTELVFFYFFLFLALQSVRHIPLLAIASAPILFNNTEFIREKILEPVLRKRIITVILPLSVLLSVIQFSDFFENIWTAREEEAVAHASGQPFGAAEYIRQNRPEGLMFNHYNFGGYLIEHLPEYKVFIDGRMPSWRDDDLHLFLDYTTMVDAKPEWQEKFDEYDPQIVVIPRDVALAQVLSVDPKWRTAFEDEAAVVFLKEDS